MLTYIAAPLHNLTKKDVPFSWSPVCTKAFKQLKDKLTPALVLAFPQFTADAPPFLLQTDASAVGAVLEQGGCAIAYASHILTKPEQQYSTIQKECLAAVYAIKQFHHYLLGCPFQLITNHAPLQWLRWRACCVVGPWLWKNTIIVYRKGSLNGNTDALSRLPATTSKAVAITSASPKVTDIQQAQQNDFIFQQLYQVLLEPPAKPQPRLKRYVQLWHQLSIVNGVICRAYCPSPHSSSVTVPVIPLLLQQQILHQVHDIPSAGHQGYLKTLSRLKEEAYWPGMAVDVQKYYQECSTCQTSKLPSPTPAQMVNRPIGNQ